MTNDELLKIFEENSALLSGHFKLSSGLHSEKYAQCALVLQNPKVAEVLCKELAGRFKDDKIDLVVGPALGGVIVAYELARQLGVPSMFTERQDAEMVLRRGFAIKPGQRVIVCEDVVTTGKSTKEVMAVVEKAGGKVAGIASLIDRSNGKAGFDVKFEGLIKVNIIAYEPEKCPLCQKGIPITKPGSRPDAKK